jgi:catechol 2,3-dioxygenase-like lactoylglutathione lyase family enzyme
LLGEHRCNATLPVEDLERARAFYSDVLKFELVEENPGGLIYGAGEGTQFLLFPTPSRPGGHTQASFRVTDLEAEVLDLQSRGVVFEEYDYPNLKTEGGIAQVGPGKAAWFKDTEGNMIGIVQFAS